MIDRLVLQLPNFRQRPGTVITGIDDLLSIAAGDDPRVDYLDSVGISNLVADPRNALAGHQVVDIDGSRSGTEESETASLHFDAATELEVPELRDQSAPDEGAAHKVATVQVDVLIGEGAVLDAAEADAPQRLGGASDPVIRDGHRLVNHSASFSAVDDAEPTPDVDQ